jgi:non-heme chloroperoxidase
MPTITTKDGVEIFYKDWGSGQPIVFSHGWPLSADDWDAQMMFFVNRGFRVIAHDRRGHGRSSQVSDGHDMDHYADDLASLTEKLNLEDAVHIGHSTGGGEVIRYLGRSGEDRVAKAAILSAVPPLMVKTDANPGGFRRQSLMISKSSSQQAEASSITRSPQVRSMATIVLARSLPSP